MAIHKKVLSIMFCAFVVSTILLSGCNGGATLEKNAKTEFPMDEKGYPQGNVVIINGRVHNLDKIKNALTSSHVESEIGLKLEEESGNVVEVTLPQRIPICLWSIEMKDYIDLVSYSNDTIEIEDKNKLEGPSPNLQTFRFKVYKENDVTVSFKWSNINEIEKSFNDKEAYYLLKLKISK